jgi:hypothetical protein
MDYTRFRYFGGKSTCLVKEVYGDCIRSQYW